jgi:hypothetical protein
MMIRSQFGRMPKRDASFAPVLRRAKKKNRWRVGAFGRMSRCFGVQLFVTGLPGCGILEHAALPTAWAELRAFDKGRPQWWHKHSGTGQDHDR